MIRPEDISVVIPTYRRGAIALDTVRHLLAASQQPGEILLVDQTDHHPEAVRADLERLKANGSIRWLVFSPPSIPKAMNTGLMEARGRVVLFLDDDIAPGDGLVAAHASRHGGIYAAVCGQVLQPGQVPGQSSLPRRSDSNFLVDMEFPFYGMQASEVRNVMAGNLSVDRRLALAIGGFDENFIGSAYRFETDFARRLNAAGHRILFAPEASLRHLRLSSGGTRSHGDHLRCPDPLHSVGDYYFAMRHGVGIERALYLSRRMFRECINRFYATHPWLVPFKFASEVRACIKARELAKRGPQLLSEARGQHL